MKNHIGFVFVFFLVFMNCSFAQVLKGRVFDENIEAVPFADIYLNGKIAKEASVYGLFFLQVNKNDTIQVFQPGYEKINMLITDLEKDTLEYDFILKPKIQEFDEVKVTAKGISKVFGNKEEHIIDYVPLLNHDFYIIKSYEKKYYLTYENEYKLTDKLQLDFHPLELFRDFFGNIHVVSADSAYQVFYEEGIQLMKAYPKTIFESQLRSVVAKGSDGLFLNTFAAHNQRYYLQFKARDKDVQTVLLIRDSVSERVALTEYLSLIQAYYNSTPTNENIIEAGIWDGDITKLMSKATKKQLIWYKVRSKPLNVHSFDRKKEVLTFDFNSGMLYKMNKKDQEVKKEKIALSFKEKPYVVFDNITEKFYFYSYEDGRATVYFYDVETGTSKRIKEVDDFAFPSKIKIADGWMYFVAPQNDFNKIFRIRV